MENITENNKLIAEFMELDWEDIVEQCKYEVYESGHRSDAIINDPDYWTCYNSSWDWLMPVVEKINNLKIQGNPEIRIGKRVEVFYSPLNQFKDKELKLFKSYEYSGIENVYEAVVEFIKWYNQKN